MATNSQHFQQNEAQVYGFFQQERPSWLPALTLPALFPAPCQGWASCCPCPTKRIQQEQKPSLSLHRPETGGG